MNLLNKKLNSTKEFKKFLITKTKWIKNQSYLYCSNHNKHKKLARRCKRKLGYKKLLKFKFKKQRLPFKELKSLEFWIANSKNQNFFKKRLKKFYLKTCRLFILLNLFYEVRFDYWLFESTNPFFEKNKELSRKVGIYYDSGIYWELNNYLYCFDIYCSLKKFKIKDKNVDHLSLLRKSDIENKPEKNYENILGEHLNNLKIPLDVRTVLLELSKIKKPASQKKEIQDCVCRMFRHYERDIKKHKDFQKFKENEGFFKNCCVIIADYSNKCNNRHDTTGYITTDFEKSILLLYISSVLWIYDWMIKNGIIL